MSWIYLIVAGLFEVAFTSCMGKVKETTGSEMYWWFTGFIISMSISMFLLIKATQALPIGTAYAVWTGIGAVGTVLAGILIFKEPSTIWRLFFIATLIGSIIGLKATPPSGQRLCQNVGTTFFDDLQSCYISFCLRRFFLIHLVTSCYIPVVSSYK